MWPGYEVRDKIAARARRDLWALRNRYPLRPQAKFWLAFEGMLLTDEILTSWEHDESENVRASMPSFNQPFFDVLIARYTAIHPETEEKRIVTSDEFWTLNPPDKYLEKGPEWLIDDAQPVAPLVERRLIVPRPGGCARRSGILCGFKFGKSAIGGDHTGPMMMCPDVRIDLIGMTYDTAEPEFNYIVEALFSESGFNIPLSKPDHPGIHKVRLTRPRPGIMPEIVLSNGAHLRVVSYENRENLKGKERDAYLFAEYYQFPGFVAYSDISQNLTARKGEAIFATTPDAAHVETLIDLGQDEDVGNWSVTLSVPRSENPYTFSFEQLEEDRKTMTREKFKIGQLGVVGQYIGSAFNYKRGERLFTPKSHPRIWHNPRGDKVRENLNIPDNWTVIGGADTGSHYSGVVAAFDEQDPPNMFILDEIANYRYVATEVEKSPNYTLSQWYKDLRAMSLR